MDNGQWTMDNYLGAAPLAPANGGWPLEVAGSSQGIDLK